MRLLTILTAALLCSAPLHAQTLKSLMFNLTNGQVVANTGTNNLSLTNILSLKGAFVGTDIGGYASSGNHAFQVVQTNEGTTMAVAGGSSLIEFWGQYTNSNNAVPVFAASFGMAQPGYEADSNAVISTFSRQSGWIKKIEVENGVGFPIQFYAPLQFGEWSNSTRANLGFSTNLNTLWTATNASGARSAIGLSGTNEVLFGNTTVSNGTFYVFKTNVGPFEGLANLISSNNTTLSNETLFRVGVAEETNRSAQFGFRVVRTNNGGEGFAVFSLYGYNALMMIGPSDRSRTNTATNAAIEADIWTISPSNRVMTLRDTNSGALTLHQDLGFGASLTNNAPTNTNTPAVWLRVWVGTNNYRLPLYQ